MAMTIDELMERLEDDAETFTAPEVRRIVEYVERTTANDAYNSARIADALQRAAQVHEEGRSQWQQLLDSIEPYKPPVLRKVGDER